MIGRRIVASKDVTIAEVSEILSQVKEEELGFEQSKTLEYAKKFLKLSKEDADAMIKELMENDKIARTKAVKIVDLMPKQPDEIKVIFAKETFSLDDKEILYVLEIVKKYSKISKKETKEKGKESKESKSKETKEHKESKESKESKKEESKEEKK